MRIHFSINYFTAWGQNMALSGTLPQLGGGDPAKAVYMNFQWRENWSYELEIKTQEPFEFKYKYIIRNSNMIDTYEWGEDRIVSVNPAVTEDLYLFDSWNNPGAIENVFMTQPFQDVLFKNNYEKVPAKNTRKYTHIFRVKAPLLKPGEALCIVGNAKALGKWDTTKALLMSNQDTPWWSIKVDLSKEKSDSVSYKFAIYDLEDKHFKSFENGPDHYAPINPQDGSLTMVSSTFVAVD
ncbi:MAG: 4-alpha-glucanotransferase, partial [Paludibacteraceae bacterium]|nr:4-alpha-glucanotransferase [Paludibacteraceae bacterium]